jgi:hypothetical protein
MRARCHAHLILLDSIILIVSGEEYMLLDDVSSVANKVAPYECLISCGRSQWQHGLKDKIASLAQRLGSWDRIPLEAWISVCAFILCLCYPSCR